MGSIFSSREEKSYAAAGGVAEEVLSTVRTIFAFGGQKRESRRCVCVCAWIPACVCVCGYLHVCIILTTEIICIFALWLGNNIQSCRYSRYDSQLAAAKRDGVFKGASVGFSVGFSYFLIFLVYSVSFW